MNIKSILAIFLIIFSTIIVRSQTADCVEKKISEISGINSCYVNNEGNILITGTFSENTDFGNSNLLKPYKSSTDGFYALINSEGKTEWVKQLSGKGNDGCSLICSDENGYIYVAGYQNSKDLSLNDIIAKTDKGKTNVFLLKINPQGDVVQYRTLSKTDDVFELKEMCVKNNQLYICGDFSGEQIRFLNQDYYIKGESDIIHALINTNNLSHLWVKKVGGNRNDEAKALAIDNNGDAYLLIESFIYQYGDSIYVGKTPLFASINKNGFLLKFNKNGDYLWNVSTYGKNGSCFDDFCLNNNNIYICGYHSSGYHQLSDTSWVSKNNNNNFILVLNNNGKRLFHRYIEINPVGRIRSISAIDNYIFFAGYYGGNIQLKNQLLSDADIAKHKYFFAASNPQLADFELTNHNASIPLNADVDIQNYQKQLYLLGKNKEKNFISSVIFPLSFTSDMLIASNYLNKKNR